jgi:hypothetical protein
MYNLPVHARCASHLISTHLKHSNNTMQSWNSSVSTVIITESWFVPQQGQHFISLPKKYLIWCICYSCQSSSLTKRIRRQMKLHCPEACPLGWNYFMLTHTIHTVYTCTHICLSALINQSITGWAKTYVIILAKHCGSKWDCRKMQPVTQDEKIHPVCLQVFDMSSIGYPADAQQQPNSSHIHHSKFTTSVNWRIIKCHSCKNAVTISVSVSRNGAVKC